MKNHKQNRINKMEKSEYRKGDFVTKSNWISYLQNNGVVAYNGTESQASGYIDAIENDLQQLKEIINNPSSALDALKDFVQSQEDILSFLKDHTPPDLPKYFEP